MVRDLSERLIISATLHGLLHDIGKPFVRLSYRSMKNIESVNEEFRRRLREFLNIDLEKIRKIGHDEFIDYIYKALGINIGHEIKEYVINVVKVSDELAASERGIRTKYREFCSNVHSEISKEISDTFIGKRENIIWDHYTAPLLSVSWIALATKYREFVGPCRRGDHDEYGLKALEDFRDLIKDFVDLAEKNESKEFTRKASNLVKQLADKPIWIPVKPLTLEILRNLEGVDLIRAIKESSYLDVVKRILESLEILKRIYKDRMLSRGFVDTLLYILRASTQLVPSAVFCTVVPDISLYSHSRAVAAYAGSFAVSNKAVLIVIDENGIQKFVSVPVKAAAASRVMRGRSILAQLVLETLYTYAQELFALTDANVLVDGGGNVSIVAPATKDLDERVRVLREIANKVSIEEMGGRLGFTVAVSRPFSRDEISYIEFIKSGKGFKDVSESLFRDLSNQKSIRVSRMLGILANPNNIKGYDALTSETVVEGLKVDDENSDYTDLLAGPGKLSVGDVISKTTHLSLVLGNVARNMVSLVSIHVYRRGKEFPRPDEDLVKEIAKRLLKNICHKILGVKDSKEDQLMCAEYFRETKTRVRIGIIPLPTAGTLYIAVSIDRSTPIGAEMEIRGNILWGIVVPLILDQIFNILSQKDIAERISSNKAKVLIRAKAVNNFRTFIPVETLIEPIRNKMEQATRVVGENFVDISFGFMFLNTFHPVKDDKGQITLKDLDEVPLLGLGKVDIDMAGQLIYIITPSISRYVTLSDLVNIAMISKVYADIVLRASGDGELFVVPLFAGGDDAVLYGEWDQVAEYISRISKSVSRILYPMTVSASYTFVKNDVPILELYRRSLELLDTVKNGGRAGASIIDDSYIMDVACSNSFEAIRFIPSDHEAWFGSGRRDPVWTNVDVGLLEKIFEELRGRYKEFEELKREIHMLSAIGHYIQEIMTDKPLKNVRPIDRVRLEIIYTYIWSRRKNELLKLYEIFKKIGLLITRFPEDVNSADDLINALRKLSILKPFLDLALVRLRKAGIV